MERIDIEETRRLDRVIRRRFRIVEGDPFNPSEIRASARRIRALGFFSNTDVSPREGSNPEQDGVDVKVEEAPTGSLSFGASYSTEPMPMGWLNTTKETSWDVDRRFR